ncbi:MAG: acyl-homoserine-lactone synthase [Sphingomicrobium sp.]
MPTTVLRSTGPGQDLALRAMFEARKQVFVDLLKWDVPVLAGRYEVDQFDDEHAVYLVLSDDEGRHLASARLLATTRPHILGTLFAFLCSGPPPAGPDCLEITRFCLDRRLRAAERRGLRDRLVLAIAQYALDHRVRSYCGVAEFGWYQQVLAMGWRCRPLGYPMIVEGRTLGALEIEIDGNTLGLLAEEGIGAFQPLASAA